MCVQCFQFPFNVGTVAYNNNYLFPAKIRTDDGDSKSTQMRWICAGLGNFESPSKRDAVSMRVMDV